MQTKQEVEQQLAAWEAQLPAGYAVTPENVNLLLEDIRTNEGGIFTVATLNRATTRVTKNPSWSWAPPEKTAEEIEFERLSALNPAAARWFQNQNILVKETRGLAALIAELQGRQVSNETIFQAIGRLQHRPGCPLKFVPGKAHEGGYGKHSGATFVDDKANPEFINGRRNHAYVPPGSKPDGARALDTTEQAWKELAGKLLGSGSTHSENARIQTAFNSAVSSATGWRNIYESTKQVTDGIKKSRMTSGNVR